MWKTSSGSMRFSINDLGFLITPVGLKLELFPELKDCARSKDETCQHQYTLFLEGITNGEFFFAAYAVLGEMLSAEPASEPPRFKKAVLRSLLSCAKSDFMDTDPTNPRFMESAAKLWELWLACRQGANLPFWEDDGDAGEPPPLDTLTTADWKVMFCFLFDELLGEPEIEDEPGNLALEDPQPYWPSFQEYRRARAWLLAHGLHRFGGPEGRANSGTHGWRVRAGENAQEFIDG